MLFRGALFRSPTRSNPMGAQSAASAPVAAATSEEDASGSSLAEAVIQNRSRAWQIPGSRPVLHKRLPLRLRPIRRAKRPISPSAFSHRPSTAGDPGLPGRDGAAEPFVWRVARQDNAACRRGLQADHSKAMAYRPEEGRLVVRGAPLSSFLDTAGPTLRDRCWLHRTSQSVPAGGRWYGLFARSHTLATSVAE
jgi:hypothetical protein